MYSESTAWNMDCVKYKDSCNFKSPVLCPNQSLWAFRFSECAETGVYVAGIPQTDVWGGGEEGAYFSKEEGLLVFTLQFGTSIGNSTEIDWQR
jgi:hypothetical protein